MQIKALKTFRHGSVNIRHGATVDLAEAGANDLIKRGYARAVEGKSPEPKSSPAPEPRKARG